MKKEIKQILKSAKQIKGTILLPEAAEDKRVREACELY